MLARRIKVTLWAISLACLCLIQFGCGPILRLLGGEPKYIPPKENVNRKLFEKFNVPNNQIYELQYYIDQEIRLDRGIQSNSNVTLDFKLEKHTTDNGDLIFRTLLPGELIRKDEIALGFLKGKKPRWRFIIHFQEPPMNLEFLENNDGNLQLLTKIEKRNKKIKNYVYFEGAKFECIEGEQALLQVDTLSIKNQMPDRYIKGAVKKREEPGGNCLGPVILGMIFVLLISLLLDNFTQ